MNKIALLINYFENNFCSINNGTILKKSCIDEDRNIVTCTEENELGETYTVVFPFEKLKGALIETNRLHVEGYKVINDNEYATFDDYEEFVVEFFDPKPIELHYNELLFFPETTNRQQ